MRSGPRRDRDLHLRPLPDLTWPLRVLDTGSTGRLPLAAGVENAALMVLKTGLAAVRILERQCIVAKVNSDLKVATAI